jgi:hypothetical protein
MTRQVAQANASPAEGVVERIVEDLAHYAWTRGLTAADELLTELLAVHRAGMSKVADPLSSLTNRQRTDGRTASTRGHGIGGSDDC